MRLDKIIPVEEDNLEKAIEKAQEIFYEKELTAEYLDARQMSFDENTQIPFYAKIFSKMIRELYNEEITEEKVKDHIYNIFEDNDFCDYLFNETINMLEKNYNCSFEKVNI